MVERSWAKGLSLRFAVLWGWLFCHVGFTAAYVSQDDLQSDTLHLASLVAHGWRICLQYRDTGGEGSIPGSGRSLRVGNGNPLHYSYWENPVDRGAWPGSWGRKVLDTSDAIERVHTHTHTHPQLLNSVVLVSDVQPSDSVTHIHVSILCEALSPFRLFQNTEQSSLCFQWVFVGYPFKIVFIKSGSKTPSL